MFQGLPPDGYVLINSKHSFEELGLAEIEKRFRPERLTTVPATEVALKHLGRPLPNTALLGGFAALSGLITLDAVAHAIRNKFTGKVADDNVAAASEAYQYIQRKMEEPAHVVALTRAEVICSGDRGPSRLVFRSGHPRSGSTVFACFCVDRLVPCRHKQNAQKFSCLRSQSACTGVSLAFIAF